MGNAEGEGGETEARRRRHAPRSVEAWPDGVRCEGDSLSIRGAAAPRGTAERRSREAASRQASKIAEAVGRARARSASKETRE